MVLQNGIPLTSGFAIARDGISNKLMFTELGAILTRLKEGRDLSSEYLKVSFIPILAKELTRVGEDTGQLDVLLMRTADILDEDVELTGRIDEVAWMSRIEGVRVILFLIERKIYVKNCNNWMCNPLVNDTNSGSRFDRL